MPRQGPNPNSEPGRELALNAEGLVCLIAFAKLPMVLLLVLSFASSQQLPASEELVAGFHVALPKCSTLPSPLPGFFLIFNDLEEKVAE